MTYKSLFIIIMCMLIVSCSRSNSIERIKGKWELYEKQFIMSEKGIAHKTGDVSLPGNFIDTFKNNSHRYGSIRKKVKVKPNINYTLYLSGINSSSKIWIDNSLVKEYGRIGKYIDEVDPYVTPSMVNFTPAKEFVYITIEFSNFHLREDLLFKWMVIGNSRDILNHYLKKQSKDYFSSGVLFIISLLFFLLYITYNKSKHNLYFSLFTLSYGIRSFFMEKTSINIVFSNIPWTFIYQFNKASELWALISILLFFKELYPKELKNRVTYSFVIISSILSVISFFPISMISNLHFMLIFHILVVTAGSYFIIRLFNSILRGRTLAKLTFFSLVFFLSSTVIDILINEYVLHFSYISAQSVILLVITMFILIAKDRTRSINSVMDVQDKNLLFKKVFSRFVPLEILSMLGNEHLRDIPPGDHTVKPLTIAYIDIRDFTKMSQQLSPEENFKMINDFYQIVGDQVNFNKGFIESYGGDGVKAIFPGKPDDAINSALNISDIVNNTSKIKIGISIHFGQVVLGTVGSQNRIQATTISDVTRILNKMDHFNSRMGVEILISKLVLSLSTIPEHKIMRLGKIKLKDEDDPIELYQVIPLNYNIDKLFKESFEKGIRMLEAKNYPRAYGYFTLSNRYQNSHLLTKFYMNQLEIHLKLKELNFAASIS